MLRLLSSSDRLDMLAVMSELQPPVERPRKALQYERDDRPEPRKVTINPRLVQITCDLVRDP